MTKKGGRKLIIVFVILSLFSLSVLSALSSAVFSYHPKYNSIEEKIHIEGRARVIILFESDVGSEESKSIHSKSGIGIRSMDVDSKENSDSVIASLSGFEKHSRLDSMDAYSGELTREGLEELKLKSQDGISIQVYEDKVFYLTDIGLLSTKYDLPPGDRTYAELDTCIDSVKANYSWDILNITGENITIAILDTGINWTNAALGGCFGNGTNDSCKVFDGIDYYNDDGGLPWDRNVHGTGIAGIISGNGVNISADGDEPKGVAPASKLLAIKVCSNDAGNGVACYTSDIIDGITWAVNHNANIISLSLGSGDDDVGNAGKDLLSQKIDWAVDNNVTVVVSAGNSGPGLSTISTPATSEKAITVGAIYTNNTPETTDDLLWYYSSSGPSAFGRLDPEIVAPGADYIMTTAQGGANFMSPGTSFAAPFVSGAAALILEQAKKQNISLTPLQVRAMLMQSSGYIYGSVFDRGAGELNIQNALTLNVYALIHNVNTYGEEIDTDRWEFIITPYSTNYANLTIFNNNDYNITLNSTTESFYNMENSNTLSGSQLKINSTIMIPNNTNVTIQINFTLSNFDSVYATTYGGLLILNGSGDNGTANISKILKIPVIITVPIYNYGYLQRNITDVPSVYSYCYYSVPSRGIRTKINWSSSDDWLMLDLYNFSGYSIGSSNTSGVNIQSVSSSNDDAITWFNIRGYMTGSRPYTAVFYASPAPFTMNVTTYSNSDPVIIDVSPIAGTINSTDVFMFYRPNNLTINITYNDSDGDVMDVTVNDTGYMMIDNLTGNSTVNSYATFRKQYSGSLARNNSITITLSDPYGATYTKNLTILLLTQNLTINSYNPTSSVIYARQNDSLTFTINATESGNQTLYYYWWINNTMNATASGINQNQSFTFNTTGYIGTMYQISAFISNSDTDNSTNETVLPWTIYLDNIPPNVTIQSPSTSSNQSRIEINYTVNDSYPSSPSAGINNCWYTINGSYNGANYSLNSTVSSCTNKTIYLGNGPYSLRVYANDSLGNFNYSSKDFIINDTFMPVVSVAPSSPSGQQASSTTTVALTVYTDENSTCRYNPYSDTDYDSMGYMFAVSQINSSFSHTTPFMVAAGNSYVIYVRCQDVGNNTNNESSVITFSVAAIPVNNGGSGGGGGGGSGGGWSDSDSLSKDFDVLFPGENNMSLYSSSIPVSQLSVNMSSQQYNGTLIVRVADPEIFDPINSTNLNDVFSYLEINLTEIPPEELLNTKIYFTVKKSWLKDNNLTKDHIVMLRYNETSMRWIALPTELLNENLMDVYYLAITPKLGLFAIGNISLNQQVNASEIISNQTSDNETMINDTNVNNTDRGDALTLLETKDNSESNGILKGINGLNNILKNSPRDAKSMLWIVWVLSGTFMFILILLMSVRGTRKGTDIKHYENELIMATSQEFKRADKELTKKVPNIPEDLEHGLEEISAEVSKKLEQELEKSVNKKEKLNQEKINKK